MPIRDTLLALLVVFIWGTSFLAIRFGVDDVPPLTLTALRFLFTALPAAFFVPRPNVPGWTLVGYGTALGIIKFSLLFSAIKLGMPIGLTSVVAQLQVFFTLGIAAVIFGETPSRLQVTGAGLAFLGIVLFGWERAQGAPLGPFLMVIGAAFFWGVANAIGKKAGTRDMLGFIVWSSLVVPVPLLALSVIVDGPAAIGAALLPPSLKTTLSITYLAVAATLVGFGLWSSLLARHPVAQVAPFALLIPLVGFACGVFVLGESVTLLTLAGTGVVLAGLAINVFGDRLVTSLRAGRQGVSIR